MPVPDLVAIEAFLRRAPYLHAYELGDLDPAELPHTTWFADAPVDAVVLLYRGLATPTVVALADGDIEAARRLLARIAHRLPARFYAHVTPGVEAALAPAHTGQRLGEHWKMGLTTRLAEAERDDAVVQLTPADADEVVEFYAEAYPGSFFEPANLTRGPYLAVRDARGIAAIAGTHVYSPAKRIASLGNIATRPDARGRGHAGQVTAALCRALQRDIEMIGLNVRRDNAAAIACYRRIGFEVRHPYEEWLFTRH